MLSNEARSIHAGLGALASAISEDAWALVRQARENLEDLADRIEEIECRATIHCAHSSLTVTLSAAQSRGELSGLFPDMEVVASHE